MITRKLPSSLQLLLTQNEFLHYMLSFLSGSHITAKITTTMLCKNLFVLSPKSVNYILMAERQTDKQTQWHHFTP